MKKLQYKNIPSKSSYGKYREYLRIAADYSCSYCTISESESAGATFNIDHFRPRKYFPHLQDDCTNLRYACPRCNSYKRDNWISESVGCIKDCDSCKSKACLQNTPRIIDCINEDPTKLIVLNDKCELLPINTSKPAEFTIKQLRLNRAQLIKLRNTRKHIDLWRQRLLDMIDQTENQIDDFENQKMIFNSYGHLNVESSNSNEVEYFRTIASIQFDLLLLHINYFRDFLKSELENLDYLSEKHIGADDENLY